MKRWKAVTVIIFVCLNVLLCFITVSVYRNHSSDYINQNHHGTGHGSLEAKSPSMIHQSFSYENARDSISAIGRREHLHNSTELLPKRASYSSASLSKTKKEERKRLTLLHYTLTSVEDRCTSGTKLLISVCSSLDNFDRREAIRATWGNRTFLEHFKIVIVFIVALPRSENQHLQDYLLKEHVSYGDIVQLNYTDHYINLSLKSMGMLLWTKEHCGAARFLLKTDDDVFVNVPYLVHLLGESAYIERSGFILGSIIQAAQPVRNRLSKWFTPESVYRHDSYPPYASGTAYMISQDVVQNLCPLIKDCSIFWLEDVFLTGILAKDLDVELIHDGRFNYKMKKRDPCWYKTTFTGHDLSPQDLIRIWNVARGNNNVNNLQWIGCQTNNTSLM